MSDVRRDRSGDRRSEMRHRALDGSLVAAGGEYGTVRSRDPISGGERGRLGADAVGHITRAFAFSADGDLPAVADQQSICGYQKA